MITNINCIRRVRPVAQNIDGLARVEPYIQEAEKLNILPQIGAHLYQWFDGLGPAITEMQTYTREDGTEVSVSPQQYEAIMFGGYFDGACCNGTGHSMGLVNAVAYYAYSRMILDNQISVTSFGVVRKRSDYSDQLDYASISRASSEAKQIADECAREVVAHLQALGLLGCCHRAKRVKKFQAINSCKRYELD